MVIIKTNNMLPYRSDTEWYTLRVLGYTLDEEITQTDSLSQWDGDLWQWGQSHGEVFSVWPSSGGGYELPHVRKG